MKKIALIVLLVVAVSLTFTIFLTGTWAHDPNKSNKVKNVWAGEWGCQYKSSPAPGQHVAVIGQMTLSAKGEFQGNTVRTYASTTMQGHRVLRCSEVGTWSEDEGNYITIKSSVQCEDYADVLEKDSECVGLLKGNKGYTEMYCIDLTDEQDSELGHIENVFITECKKSESK